MRGITAALFLSIILLGAAESPAEEFVFEQPPPFEAGISFALRSWTISKEGSPDRKVSLWTTPVEVSRRVGRNASVSLRLRDAIASARGEEKSDYAGPTDAVLAAAFFPAAGTWRVDLRFGLPTGRAPIDPDEELLAGVMANRLLGLPVKRLGEGFDIGLGAARVFRVPGGPLLSAGAGFLRKGEYDYMETAGGAVKYKPGDEAYLAAGAESEIEADGIRYLLTGDLRYRFFRRDERNGEGFYDEGNEAELLTGASIRFPGGGGLDFSALFLFKGEGSEEGAFAAGAPDSLSLERYLARALTGDAQEIRADYSHPVSSRARLLAFAGFSRYGEYEGPAGGEGRLLGSGMIWRTGGGARLRIGGGLLEIRLAGLFGEAEEGKIDLSGLDIFSSLFWVF